MARGTLASIGAQPRASRHCRCVLLLSRCARLPCGSATAHAARQLLLPVQSARVQSAHQPARLPALTRSGRSAHPHLLAPSTPLAASQELYTDFGRSDAIIVSTKSNMGSFLLTWWGAANGDASARGSTHAAAGASGCDVAPPLVDMDAKVKTLQINSRRKFFCALNWGSRHGMCESNRTAAAASGARPNANRAANGRGAGPRNAR